MAESVELISDQVFVKVETPRVAARVETPLVPADPSTKDIPVLVVPGQPGAPGKDGVTTVVGGAMINDATVSSSTVWSSQHTRDQDNAVVESLTPEIDLILLFNNALA